MATYPNYFAHVTTNVLHDSEMVKESLDNAGVKTFRRLLDVRRNSDIFNALKYKDPQTKQMIDLPDKYKEEIVEFRNFVNWLQNNHGTIENFPIDIINKTNRDLFRSFLLMNAEERRGEPDGTVKYDVDQALESEEWNQLGRFAPSPAPSNGGDINTQLGRFTPPSITTDPADQEDGTTKKGGIFNTSTGSPKSAELAAFEEQLSDELTYYPDPLKDSTTDDLADEVTTTKLIDDPPSPTISTSSVNEMSLHEVEIVVEEILSLEKDSPTESNRLINSPSIESSSNIPIHCPLVQVDARSKYNVIDGGAFQDGKGCNMPIDYHDDGFTFNVSEASPSEPVGVTKTNPISFNDVLLINNSIDLSNAVLSFGKQSSIFDRGINIVDVGRSLNNVTTTLIWGAELILNINSQPLPISTGGLHSIITPRSASFLRFGDRTPSSNEETYVFNSSDRIYEVRRRQWVLIMGADAIRLIISPQNAQHHRIHATIFIRLPLRYKFDDAVWGDVWNKNDVWNLDIPIMGICWYSVLQYIVRIDEWGGYAGVIIEHEVYLRVAFARGISDGFSLLCHPTTNTTYESSTKDAPPFLIQVNPSCHLPSFYAKCNFVQCSTTYHRCLTMSYHAGVITTFYDTPTWDIAHLPSPYMLCCLIQLGITLHVMRHELHKKLSYKEERPNAYSHASLFTSDKMIGDNDIQLTSRLSMKSCVFDTDLPLGLSGEVMFSHQVVGFFAQRSSLLAVLDYLREIRLLDYVTPSRYIDVDGVRDIEVRSLRIGTFAAKTRLSDGMFVLLIFHEYGELIEGNTVHSKIQISDGGCEVYEDPISLGGWQCIIHEEGIRIPVVFQRGLACIEMIYPSDDDIETLPRFAMTRNVPWDPTKYDKVRSRPTITEDPNAIQPDPSNGEHIPQSIDQSIRMIGEPLRQLQISHSSITTNIAESLSCDITNDTQLVQEYLASIALTSRNPQEPPLPVYRRTEPVGFPTSLEDLHHTVWHSIITDELCRIEHTTWMILPSNVMWMISIGATMGSNFSFVEQSPALLRRVGEYYVPAEIVSSTSPYRTSIYLWYRNHKYRVPNWGIPIINDLR